MTVAEMILAYLEVLLSAPPIIGVIVITFLALFRVQLAALIERIARIKLPGGGEVFTSQQIRSAESDKGDAPEVPDESAVDLPHEVKLTPEQAEKVVQLIRSERANAYLWEYRYLNFFLVRQTQMVLDWLATFDKPVSTRLIDSQLQTWIPDAKERQAILNALISHHLVNLDGELLEVTPKGKEYLEWRGPLPPLPSS